MEVRMYPNSMRPDVGLTPRREAQRPLLPQHSRHCPVLEAGNAAGFMVYPALEPKESFYVEYEGEGRYKFIYYVQGANGKFNPIFVLTLTQSVGTVGMIKEEVTFPGGVPLFSKEVALQVARVFIFPQDMGTPTGAVALRGATNFMSPPGWDTLYVPVFNMVERPVAPMMVVRVETDWYAHESEFRYVLQPGEGITGSHSIPIGQVLFVPREEVALRNVTEAELETIRASQVEFANHKASITQKTPYGLTYSPHYLRETRAHRQKDHDEKGEG